jgi:hypothetical protein
VCSLINIPNHGLCTFDEFICSAYREETFAFLLVMSFLAWLIEKRLCIGVGFAHKVMAQTQCVLYYEWAQVIEVHASK